MLRDMTVTNVGEVAVGDLLGAPWRAGSTTPQSRRWTDAARAVADRLAQDLLERDRRNQPPRAEVELLRESGLLPLVVPARYGGRDQSWNTAFEVVRLIARVDASIAHILGYHYVWQTRIHHDISAGETPLQRRLLTDGAAGPWLWASTGPSATAPLRLHPEPRGGFRIVGKKGFATGACVADMLVGVGRHADTDDLVYVQVDPRRAGVDFVDDWDMLGQRLSASNGLVFTDYRVGVDEVLGVLPQAQPPAPGRSLAALSFQLMICHLLLGAAEGALLRARTYTRMTSTPWLHAQVSAAVDDPHLLRAYGDLASGLTAASALLREARDALQWAYDHPELSSTDRRDVAGTVAAAKISATTVSLDTTTRVYDVTGARACRSDQGMDLYWRNVRTLTLRDPVDYKRDELGRCFVTGEVLQPSPYR